MPDLYLQWYNRRDVQEQILASAFEREAAPRYNEGFGKRPDTLNYPGDVLEFARKGATSFHISEERWEDPFSLKPGMIKRDLDEKRKGWDLVLDLDTAYWDYAQWTAYFLIEALKFHDVKNIAVKYSGSKGFHIAVPFESFPDEVNGRKTKYLFPEGPRVIAAYLKEMIKKFLSKKILEKESITQIMERSGKKRSDLILDGQFDPFILIDIDTILISNRHLFRSPYSLHEKTGNVSLPIPLNQVLSFKKEDAHPDKVKTFPHYLQRDLKINSDAKSLIIQAFDWFGKNKTKYSILETPDIKQKTFALPANAISEDLFPLCISKLLKGRTTDGRKRTLFILLQFLKHMNWRWEDIEARLTQWNQNNKPPLPQPYLKSQLSWHKKQEENILPPNCANSAYYKELGVQCEEQTCTRYKNPVNVALKHNWEKEKKEKKS